MSMRKLQLVFMQTALFFRRENNWESPKTAVSGEMDRLGFTDCWAGVGRPGLLGTCRSVISDKIFTP